VRLARPLGRWDAARRTPVNALLAQGAIALALVALGATTRRGFETMVEYTAPVFWFFIGLTGIALFVLRRRDPGRPRPFRVPLFPLTPLVFCATSGYLVYSSLAYAGIGALAGVAVLAAGVLVLCVTRP
jgi:basic amino acid/polyamine antiporter, APA family